MSKQLYEEALADVKKLKEVAEDNAKRALLEAVTPRIRDLIENQLLGEAEKDDDSLLMDEVPEGGFEEPAPVDASAGFGDADAAAAAMSTPDDEGKVTLDLDALKTSSGEYELSREAAEKLGMLMSSGTNNSMQFETKLRKVVSQTKLFASASKIIKESAGYSEKISIIISQVRDMYQYLQESMQHTPKKKVYEKTLRTCYATLKQLTEQKMKKTRNSLSEAEITLKLTGVPDDLADKLDDLGVDLITGGGDEGGDEEESGDEESDDELDLGGEEEGGDEEESDEEGGGDELDLGDEDEESDDEESEEKMESRRLSDNTIVEIDEGMLRREISRMKALREADETKPQSWGNGPGDVSDEFEDDDFGDPFVDVDLNEVDEMDEVDEMEEVDQVDEVDEMDELDQAMKQAQEEAEEKDEMDELDELDQAMKQAQEEAEEKDEMDELDQAMQADEKQQGQGQKQQAVESLRRRLAAEVRLQTEAKQKAQGAKKQAQQKQKEAQQKKQMAQQKMKEAQQKAKQGKKQEAQQKKKEAQQKQKEAQQKAKQAKQMKEAYVYFATRFNESVARTNKIKSVLAEAARKGSVLNGGTPRSAGETANLRNKLAETNLFNAKLLYTNKLLQNESLTKRQKAEVIERLDEARSEREVKLVYESLTKALQGTTSRQLSESTDRGVLGSSSRPARPASTNLNEGFEADRWARLAGIIK